MTPDGRSIISVRGGEYVTVWDADTGALCEDANSPIRFILFPNLALPRWTMAGDRRWGFQPIDLVNLQTGYKPERGEFAIKIYDTLVQSACLDKAIRSRRRPCQGIKVVKVWDIATGKNYYLRLFPPSIVNNIIDFTPDGKGVIADFTRREYRVDVLER